MAWGSIVSAAIGAGSSLLGGFLNNRAKDEANQMDVEWARESQQKDQDFQREVYQNQYQWKADDARKAGLHPLAIIGGGSYSASPTSQPVNVQSGNYSYLGKMGEYIGDAVHAYMTKDEREAAKAEEDRRAAKSEFWDDQKQLATGRLLDAQTEYYSALAMKTAREALRYSNPMADGFEIIGGQTDANAPRKFERYRNPDGSLSGRLPTEQYQGIYDDKQLLEYKPGLEALYWDARDFLADRFGLWNWRGARHGY